MQKQLYSLIESPFPIHLLDNLCQSLDIHVEHFNSSRKIMKAIKKQAPDYVLAEFFYGYSNNYAGVNLSNLDVMLYGMQTSAPDTKVLVISQKDVQEHIHKLNAVFPIAAEMNWQTIGKVLPRVLEN